MEIVFGLVFGDVWIGLILQFIVCVRNFRESWCIISKFLSTEFSRVVFSTEANSVFAILLFRFSYAAELWYYIAEKR